MKIAVVEKYVYRPIEVYKLNQLHEYNPLNSFQQDYHNGLQKR